MVFQNDFSIDYELEELDEFQLSRDIPTECDLSVACSDALPCHLIIGLTPSVHAFMDGFGFKKTFGSIQMGSLKWDILGSDDGSIWTLKISTSPETNRLAQAIADKIQADLITILDIILDDQINSDDCENSVGMMKLESSYVKFKSKVTMLPIPGFITGFSAALLGMLENRKRQCRVFLTVSDYHSQTKVDPEVVQKLMDCVPELFDKNECQTISSKVKTFLSIMKPMERSSMFV